MASLSKGPPPSTGAAVSELQGLLTAAGYPTAVTGTFDDATDASVRAFQQAKGLTIDGKAGPATMSSLSGKQVFNPSYGKNAKFGRDTLLNVWPSVLAEGLQSQYAKVRQLSSESTELPEEQIIQANAQLESGYGMAQYTNKVTNEKSGVINNWGAVQAGNPPCNPATAFEASDTHGDGTAYTWCYKKYATPEDGARDLLKQFTLRRPTGWRAAKNGDIDAAVAAWGKKDPVTSVGLYFEQAANSRAKGLQERIWAIADALGEPVAAQRGGPIPLSQSGEPLGTTVPGAVENAQTQASDNQKSIFKIALAGLAAWLGYKYFIR